MAVPWLAVVDVAAVAPDLWTAAVDAVGVGPAPWIPAVGAAAVAAPWMAVADVAGVAAAGIWIAAASQASPVVAAARA